MNMRLLSFKTIAATLLAISMTLCAHSHAYAAEPQCAHPDTATATGVNTAYYKRLQKRQERWNRLIPDLFALQYAGGIGMISAGPGWDYGSSRQWETHVLVGFLPKRYKYHHYWTFTVRETYSPWNLRIKNQWSVKPLTVSLSLNSILHSDFWTSQPDRYPDGYYGFSTRIRFHLGLGQRFSYDIPESKRFLGRRISVYYEISTCDLYVRQKVLNSYIPLKDILSIGAGLIYTI
ncbi:MAG: hypothetical protein JFR38_10280 [Muribaculaceae bacterium]|nr:hypothetical protein [Muribaculaceae bacterium]